MDSHIKRCHEGIKIRPYYCVLCDRSFDGKRHELVHSKIKPYKCNICSQAFSNPGNMKRHKLVHSNERPFTCTECNDSFKLDATLQGHIRRKHKKDKNVKCKNCLLQFITLTEMKKWSSRRWRRQSHFFSK